VSLLTFRQIQSYLISRRHSTSGLRCRRLALAFIINSQRGSQDNRHKSRLHHRRCFAVDDHGSLSFGGRSSRRRGRQRDGRRIDWRTGREACVGWRNERQTGKRSGGASGRGVGGNRDGEMQFFRLALFPATGEPPVLVSATFKFVPLSALFAEKCLFNFVYRHCKIFTRSLLLQQFSRHRGLDGNWMTAPREWMRYAG